MNDDRVARFGAGDGAPLGQVGAGRPAHRASVAPDSAPGFIPVTRPYLPPLAEFQPWLAEIWRRKWVTNNGVFHQQLEAALCEYLEVEHLSLFASGTLALITALQVQRITGEVITTPFSFVATSHALHWNGIKPVFVDIDPISLTLDPARIEDAITPRTAALLPVHVYGKPCAVDRIQAIADAHGLSVIYDAAHAFGVRVNERSILDYGDLSILSFHATKIFNTFEGGAIICRDADTKQRLDYLKNFGFADETTVVAPGINGKLNEIQAAFGLLQLQHMPRISAARAAIDARYRAALAGVDGLMLYATPNHSYFPIRLDDGFPVSRDALYHALRDNGIGARRYFHPLISQFSTYKDLPSAAPENLPVATAVARQVLCLPIYPGLEEHDQQRIIDIVLSFAGRGEKGR